MPPHSIDEWAALFTIMSISIGGLIGLVNVWVIRPLKYMMSNLSEKFGTLNDTLQLIKGDVDRIDEKVDKHETRITVLEEVTKNNG